MISRAKLAYLATLFVAAAAAGCGPSQEVVPGESPTSSPADALEAELQPDSPFKVGDSFTITPPIAPYVLELQPSELDDQVREWAVFAAVARLGASPLQAANATYELPPARLPYMDQLYELETGSGRRAYVGKRVILFRDDDDRDPQATIGRLADRVRMESGVLPPKLELYLIEDHRDDGTIRVTRAPDLGIIELFSPAFGYYEASVADLEQLGDWLAKVDDVSFMEIADDKSVTLGGRRFEQTRTENVTAEDIAALYQGHRKVDDKLDDKLLADLDFRSLSVDARHQVRTGMAGKEGPGFSLDPVWLPSALDPNRLRLADSIERLLANPCDELRAIAKSGVKEVDAGANITKLSSRTLIAIALARTAGPRFTTSQCDALKEKADLLVRPLLAPLASTSLEDGERAEDSIQTVLNEIMQKDSPSDEERLLYAALHYYVEDSKVQCARYEGTAGTEVGMTLFYTDLLAKLWTVADYGSSAPLLGLPGFESAPHQKIPASFRERDDRIAEGRLWFAPHAQAISEIRTDGETSYLFDHHFSRIFAANHALGSDEEEEAPDESSRRIVSWWTRHFDEVANYEQKFHRLNQIMKWSALTGALLEHSAAAFLGSAPIRETLQFNAWMKANARELRFSELLKPPHMAVPGRECLPVLTSAPYSPHEGRITAMTGGVSTMGRASSRELAAVTVGEPFGTRRAAVTATTGPGSASRPMPLRSDNEISFVRTSSATEISTPRGRISLGEPAVSYPPARTPGELRIKARGGAKELGELTAKVRSNHAVMSWDDADIPPAKTLAEADQRAMAGDLSGAARYYAANLDLKALGDPEMLGRSLITASIYKNAAAAVRLLLQKETQLALMSSEMRSAVVAAVKPQSPALAEAIAAGRKLPQLTTSRGQLTVLRDVRPQEIASLKKVTPTDFDDDAIYVDTRFSPAREGLLHAEGNSAARWRQMPNVRIEVLRTRAIDALPDQLRLPSGKTLARVPAPENPALIPRTPSVPTKIYLISPCKTDEKNRRAKSDKPAAAERTYGC